MRDWFIANVNSAVLIAIIAAIQTFILTRHQRTLRNESHTEHVATQTENKAAISTLAEKVAAETARVADKVEVTTATIVGAIAENTAMTVVAATASKEAAEVANNMNAKFTTAVETVKKQQEHEADHEGDHP